MLIGEGEGLGGLRLVRLIGLQSVDVVPDLVQEELGLADTAPVLTVLRRSLQWRDRLLRLVELLLLRGKDLLEHLVLLAHVVVLGPTSRRVLHRVTLGRLEGGLGRGRCHA